jgi:hypothetical protein
MPDARLSVRLYRYMAACCSAFPSCHYPEHAEPHKLDVPRGSVGGDRDCSQAFHLLDGKASVKPNEAGLSTVRWKQGLEVKNALLNAHG